MAAEAARGRTSRRERARLAAAAKDAPAGVVRLRTEDGRFLGTGILVSPENVLTCAHVVAGSLSLRVEKPSTAAGSSSEEKAPEADAEVVFPRWDEELHSADSDDDLALVQVAQPLATNGATFVEGLSPSALRAASGRLHVHGFGARGALGAAHGLALRGSLWTQANGAVRIGQTDGGVPPGLSGSPLLLWEQGEWLVAGMYYLGGDGAGQSTFYGADVLIAFLRRLGVEPRVRSAACIASLQPAAEDQEPRTAKADEGARPRKQLGTSPYRAGGMSLIGVLALALLGIGWWMPNRRTDGEVAQPRARLRLEAAGIPAKPAEVKRAVAATQAHPRESEQAPPGKERAQERAASDGNGESRSAADEARPAIRAPAQQPTMDELRSPSRTAMSPPGRSRLRTRRSRDEKAGTVSRAHASPTREAVDTMSSPQQVQTPTDLDGADAAAPPNSISFPLDRH